MSHDVLYESDLWKLNRREMYALEIFESKVFRRKYCEKKISDLV